VRGREVMVRVATAGGSGVTDLDLDWVALLDGGR
jgi:hypothetical protein